MVYITHNYKIKSCLKIILIIQNKYCLFELFKKRLFYKNNNLLIFMLKKTV